MRKLLMDKTYMSTCMFGIVKTSGRLKLDIWGSVMDDIFLLSVRKLRKNGKKQDYLFSCMSASSFTGKTKVRDWSD